MGIKIEGLEHFPYHEITLQLQHWHSSMNDPRCGWISSATDSVENMGRMIWSASIVLPISYCTLKLLTSPIQLLFIDGTSGLINDPYVNIIWLHIVDNEGNVQIVGQLLCNGKTYGHYEQGLGDWKGLITEYLGKDRPITNDGKVREVGKWGCGFGVGVEPPLTSLDVDSTMTDREQAMLNSLETVIKPNNMILCRFHVLQALSRKVLIPSHSYYPSFQ